MAVAALGTAGCPQPLFDGPPPHPGAPTTAPTTDPGVTTPPPSTAPPAEIACNGRDDDRDGHPAADAACDKAPDAVITSIDPDTPFADVVPDLDGDGLDDIVATSGSPRAAWLISGLSGSGTDESLAFDWVELSVVGDGRLWDSRAGELDGQPGVDLWVADQLFLEPEATDWLPDAVWVEHEPFLALADFDGDGVDEILASRRGPFADDVLVGAAPFAGGLDLDDWLVVVPSQSGAWVAGDVDGDGLPEIGVQAPDGSAALVDRAGAALASFPVLPGVARAGGDFDGDGLGDVIVSWTDFADPLRPCEDWLLAGPFAGTVDPDDHTSVLVTSVCEEVAPMPDFDFDGATDLTGRSGAPFALSSAEASALGADPVAAASWRAPLGASLDPHVTWGELDGKPGVDALDSDGVTASVFLDVAF